MGELEEFPVALQDFKLNSKSMLTIKNYILRVAALLSRFISNSLAAAAPAFLLDMVTSPPHGSRACSSSWPLSALTCSGTREFPGSLNFQCCPNLLHQLESKYWLKNPTLNLRKIHSLTFLHQFHSGLYTENCFVLAEGKADWIIF